MPLPDRTRVRLAQEAARIMIEQGIREHEQAKRKAARRLGVPLTRSAPRNEEIDAALLEYQRIYRPQAHSENLARLRTLASEAMRFLSVFAPLLAGGVWDGSANRFSPITLHLFTDTAEEVLYLLSDKGIPFEEGEHLPAEDRRAILPACSFYADGTRIELLIFPTQWKGRSLRRKDGKRAGGTLAEVLELRAEAEKGV